MKKLTALLAGAMLIMGMATTANALSMRYSLDGATWHNVADNGLGDTDLSLGGISTTGSLGAFSSISLSSHTINAPDMGQLFTNTFESTSTTAGTLYVQVTDLPYSLTMAPGAQALSSLTFNIGNATVDFETFYGTGAYDKSHLIADFDLPGAVPGGNFETHTLNGLANPFSLTEELIIHHNGKTTTQATAVLEVTPVPEPGTMMLLGAGFLGLAIYGKRRKNA